MTVTDGIMREVYVLAKASCTKESVPESQTIVM